MRARLLAREKIGLTEELDPEATAPKADFVFETPLIEQGSIILGGTKQEFGFALRQQYFHKSVMLLLQHDEFFTKGIILNRISALEIDGWRVWFGGDVAEGGMFRGGDTRKGELEIVCLHSLESVEAERLSLPIIKGVSQTTLEGAKALVAAGDAVADDFTLFVGYAGWAPKQLQGELERDSWYLAAADSAVLLQELLRQGSELPPPSSGGGAVAGDGLKTWETLMERIGKDDEVTRTRDSLEDRMLKEWVKVHLLPSPEPPELTEPLLPPTAESLPGVILRSGPQATKFKLAQQFLHKALVLLIHEAGEGLCVGVVLNRPTAKMVQMKLDGKPRRCISFGGEARLRGGGLDVESNGLLWLHRIPELGGSVAIGDCGVFRIPAQAAAAAISDGRASLNDFLIVAGVMAWGRDDLEQMLDAGDLELATDEAKPLLEQVWALADAPGGDSGLEPDLSDGTGLWWASCQGAKGGSMQTLPSAQLGDECLEQWLKFFGGHVIDEEEE